MQQFYTIGMAGHIDHGKTALTKAITGIETDRLKEEQERHISIENGFAYFELPNGEKAAVIDVPGHEKFIRQMIAGVAGIDLVLIVIAADEGIMPQTEEHLTILNFLNIKESIVVITKCDLVDEEWLTLVKEEISQELHLKGFDHAPVIEVDSLSNRGIDTLKEEIAKRCSTMKPKNSQEPFRLPIDDIFTLHGQGTIVRGTVFNGSVSDSEELLLLPQNKKVRVRQLQVHHEQKSMAYASQRVAINLGGITKAEIHRGDVLVSSDLYKPTERIDVFLETTNNLQHHIKQRGPVMFHLGTAVSMGKIIFFDRNQLNEGESVYCQIQLDKPLIAKRGDRFIIRRPSPVETIGGGWVIDASAKRHRFGSSTSQAIEEAALGTPEDRLLGILKDHVVLSYQSFMQEAGMTADDFSNLVTQLLEEGKIITFSNNLYTSKDQLDLVETSLSDSLEKYSEEHPLRWGMNKAEWLKTAPLDHRIAVLAAQRLEANHLIKVDGPLVSHFHHVPSFPKAWEKRMLSVIQALKKQGLTSETWSQLCEEHQLPKQFQDELKQYLIKKNEAYLMEEETLIDKQAFDDSIQQLKAKTTKEFTIKEAKDILGLSRKYIIPYLELCDRLGLTKRQENVRIWV